MSTPSPRLFDPKASQARIAFNVLALTTLYSLAAALFHGYVLATTGNTDWQLYVLIAGYAVVAGVGVLATLASRSRLALGWLYLVIALQQAAFLLTGLLFKRIGLPVAFANLVLVIAFAVTLPATAARVFVVSGALVSGVLVYLDTLVTKRGVELNAVELFSTERLSHLAQSQTFFVYALIGLLAFAFILAYRHAQAVGLRTKLIIAFLVVVFIPIGLLTYLNDVASRAALTAAANNSLKAAASRTANALDNYLRDKLENIGAEAQLPTFTEYLRIVPELRSASLAERQVVSLLAALQSKERPIVSEPGAPTRMARYVRFYALTDLKGIVLVSAPSVQTKRDFSKRFFFNETLKTNGPYVSPVEFSEANNEASIYFASIVLDDSRQPAGVLVAQLDAQFLTDELQASKGVAGDNSFPILLDENQVYLAHSTLEAVKFKTVAPLPIDKLVELQEASRLPHHLSTDLTTNNTELEAQLNAGQEFFRSRETSTGDKVDQASITTLNTQPWRVVFLQPEEEFLSDVDQQTNNSILAAMIIAAAVAIIGLIAAQALTRPITHLTTVAEKVIVGDLNVRAPVETSDEIGQLATTFNSMTTQLRDLIGSLEQRVAARTAQLEASNDVGRAASSVLDPDELIHQTVNLITNRFGFYYAAVFLSDDSGRWAVLNDATGEAGKVLKQRGHKLELGGQSMVSSVMSQRKPRIALDTGTEAVRFANPLLPETRSEIALPLIAGGAALGALDVQSTQRSAFDESSTAVLQGMADQLAIAIQNARLFQETTRNLRESSVLEKFSGDLNAAQDVSAILAALVEHLQPQGASQVAILNFENAASGERDMQIVIIGHQQADPAQRNLAGQTFSHDRWPLLNALTANKPLVINDVQVDLIVDETSRATYQELGWQAALLIPLSAAGKLRGAIVFAAAEPLQFRAEDVRLAHLAADQTAITLENADLLTRTTVALRESSRLYQITNGISRATDIQEILKVVIANAFPATAHSVSVWTYERRGDQIIAAIMLGSRSVTGKEGQPNYRLSLENFPAIKFLYENAEPLVVNDVLTDPRLDPVSRETYRVGNVNSAILIRLVVGARLIGILQVASPEATTYTADEVRLLQTTGDQVAIALENRRLLEEAQQNAERQAAANTIFSAIRAQSASDAALQTAVYGLGKALHVARAFVWMGSESAELTLAQEYNREGMTALGLGRAPALPDALRAVWQKSLVMTQDVNDRRLANLRDLLVTAYITVPLLIRDELIGVLGVHECEHARHWTSDEMGLVQETANQLAITLENIRLVEQLQRSLSEVEELNRLFIREGWEGLQQTKAITESRKVFSLTPLNAEEPVPLIRPVSLPLSVRGEKIGALNYHLPPGLDQLTEEDKAFVAAIVDQTALALDNARLIEQTQQRVRELGIINSFSQALTSQRDLLGMIELVGDRVSQIMAHDTFVALYNKQTNLVEVPYFMDDHSQRQTVAPFPYGQGLTSVVIRMRQPLLINHDALRRTQELGAIGIGAPAQSWLGVPIILGDEVMGVIGVQDQTHEGLFSEADVRLLTTIAANVGVALQNARLFADSQQRAQQLASLNELSRAISGELNRGKILEILGQQMQQLVQLDSLYISLYNPDTHALFFHVKYDLGHYAEPEETALSELTLSRQVVETRQPLLLLRTPEQMAEAAQHLEADRQASGSIMIAPFVIGENVLGLVSPQSYTLNSYTEDHLTLLINAASQVAVALENARLFEETQRRAQQLAAAAEVSRTSISVLDPNQLIPQTVELIRERFNLYYAALFLVDKDGKWAVLRHATGEAGQVLLGRGHKLEIGGASMVGATIVQRQARIALDVGTESVRFANPLLPDTRSEMALPLAVGETVLGALDVQSTQSNAFSEADLTVLQTMGDQIAIAIRNAQLLSDMQTALQALDYERYLLNTLLENVPDKIYFKDDHSRFIRVSKSVASQFGTSPDEIVGKSDFDFFNKEHAQQAFEDEQAMLKAGQAVIGKLERETWPDRPDTWVLTSKLILRDPEGKVIGSFGVSKDVTELQQAQEAIQQRAEQLAALNRVASAATSNLDLTISLSAVAREVVPLFDVRNCGIALYIPEARIFRVIADHSRHADDASAVGTTFPLDGNLSSEEVMNTRKALSISDAQNHPLMASIRDLMVARKTEAIAIAPLLVRGSVIGTIAVDTGQKGREFTESEVALLETIARQLATAVENARLFTETQRRAQQLAAASEIGRAASSTLDLDVLLANSVNLIRERFEFYHVSVFIIQANTNLAVIRESTGEAGRQLKARRHQLAVGSKSLVGTATATRQPVIVQDVTLSPNYFKNPILPDTRAEAVIPLLSGDSVTGALDVQSASPGVFGADDMAILGTIADQLAVAVQNARLFNRTARQARREKLVVDITSKIRAAGDVDSMLRIAVGELRQALGVSHGAIRLGGKDPAKPKSNGQHDPEN